MSREQLEAHPAYSDPKHADNALVSKLVNAAYVREFGTADAT